MSNRPTDGNKKSFRPGENRRPSGSSRYPGTRNPHSGKPGMKEGRFRENRGVTPARALALEALMDVFSSDAYSTLTLDRRLKAETRMSDPDRRLATELFYGVLERKIQLEYILNQRME